MTLVVDGLEQLIEKLANEKVAAAMGPPGMSRLQWYAGQAMIGFLGVEQFSVALTGARAANEFIGDRIARLSFGVAKAMVAYDAFLAAQAEEQNDG